MIKARTKEERANTQIYIRDAAEGDIPFIFNSWLKSFRAGAFCKYVDNNFYFTEHHKLVEKLLKRSKTLVACNPDNPEDLYGYLTHETIDGIYVAHFAYTKHTFRNLGILKSLLAKSGFTGETAGLYTHSLATTVYIGPRFNLHYNPYIFVNYMEEK